MKKNRDGEVSSAESCMHFTLFNSKRCSGFLLRLLLYGYMARRYKKHHDTIFHSSAVHLFAGIILQ